MNQKMIETLANDTRYSQEICQAVVVAYEEYCAEEHKMPFSKKLDEAMITELSRTTGLQEEVVMAIVTVLIIETRRQLKNKLPFLGKS